MARGNIALIDGVSALAVVLILYSVVVCCDNNSAEHAFQAGIEREQVRSQLYTALFSGELQGLLSSKYITHFEAGGLVLDTIPPANATFVKFFISDDFGGVREFFVFKKG